MKKLKFITLLFITILFLTACSKDNDENVTITGDYFPSALNNYWNYDVKSTDNGTKIAAQSQDFISVDSGTSTNFKLDANNGNTANGVMSTILTNGQLIRTGSELLINGKLEIPIAGFETLSIPLVNAVLYDLNANNGSTLSSFEGELTQVLNGLPFTLVYKLSFNKGQNQNSLKVKTVTYNKVTSTNIKLNLTIKTEITINTIVKELTVLNAQDLLSVKAYYGENVGLLLADAVVNFELDADAVSVLKLAGVELNAPVKQSITSKEELSSYKVN